MANGPHLLACREGTRWQAHASTPKSAKHNLRPETPRAGQQKSCLSLEGRRPQAHASWTLLISPRHCQAVGVFAVVAREFWSLISDSHRVTESKSQKTCLHRVGCARVSQCNSTESDILKQHKQRAFHVARTAKKLQTQDGAYRTVLSA